MSIFYCRDIDNILINHANFITQVSISKLNRYYHDLVENNDYFNKARNEILIPSHLYYSKEIFKRFARIYIII